MSSKPQLPGRDYPAWSPRFWHGMQPSAWFSMLARHRFRIPFLRWGLTLTVSPNTFVNGFLGLIQSAFYSRRIANVRIHEPPIFILGHWRSGTTFLHELLMHDRRFATPNTYQCLAPGHFLASEWFFSPLLAPLLPKKRPMDNMLVGMDRPQEDEFALVNLGLPSTYERMAFPNDPPLHMNYLDMEGLTPEERAHWKATFTRLLQMLTVRWGKQLVLKSPPHTGRIGVLAEMFPEARFIHLVRNPFELYPSTVRLWQSLDYSQGLQIPHDRDLSEFVFTCLTRMYRGFESQREKIAPERIIDLRYEDLVQAPLAQLERIYTHLNLGEFADVRPRLVEYVATIKDYQRNKHQLDDTLREEITRRWGDYLERYGYREQLV